MMTSACLVQTDLSHIELSAHGERSTWNGPTRENGGSDTVEQARLRIGLSAQWMAAQSDLDHGLDLVCLDVGESRCQWLKSPSTQEQVLAATLKTAAQDWGELMLRGCTEALTHDDRSKSARARGPAAILARLNRPVGSSADRHGAVASAVLHVPDAIIRLWLDELDCSKVPVNKVATLWHAVATAWAASPDAPPPKPDEPLALDESSEPPTELTAVALVDADGRRIVWSWSIGADLLAAGTTSIPVDDTNAAGGNQPPTQLKDREIQRSGSRLSLDWLAWAGHLSRTPDRIRVVGPACAAALSEDLGRRWPETAIDTIVQDDPIIQTISRAASAGTGPHRRPVARRCLVGLSRRPTRDVRRQYQWMAVALTLLAVGIGGFGWRLREVGSELTSEAAHIRADAGARADGVGVPSVKRKGNKIKALGSVLATLQKQPGVTFPPEPRPVFSELKKAVEAMLPFKDDGDLMRISIDGARQSIVQFTIADLHRRTDLEIAFRDMDSGLLWQHSPRASRPDMLQLEAQW